MYLLHNIGDRKLGSNYNTLEEITDSEGPLSFDGVYMNVFDHASILEGRDVTLFIMGVFVGGDNSFDAGQRFESLCDWNELMAMAIYYGHRLGWHTWSHPDLTLVNDEELARQVRPPFPMEDFAYPYGKFDARVQAAVRAAGFKRAWGAGPHHDDTDFGLRRDYLNW